MADPNIQLPSLPSAALANNSDLMLLRQGAEDKKATLQVIKDKILNGSDYTGADILTLLAPVDGASSGLDADLLDGQHGSFYRNAANLNAGTINSDRLNATDLLNLLLGVDGSGSNLDADRLDGQHGSFYRNANNINAGTISPNRLPTANTTTRGAIELATQNEVNSGSGSNTAVAPSRLRSGFLSSFAQDGYVRLPAFLGNLTVMWGITPSGPSGNRTQLFPLPFPNACRGVMTTFWQSPGTTSAVTWVNSFNTSGFNFAADSAALGGRQAIWFAWGH